MKKLIVFILIILLIGMVGSCWFNKQDSSNNIENRVEVNDGVDTIYPVNFGTNHDESAQYQTDGVKGNTDSAPNLQKLTSSKYISTETKVKLMFDAPVGAHYVISDSKQLLNDKTIQLDMDGDKRIETLTLGLDHPNGVRVLAIKNGDAQNLMNSVQEGDFFDDYGDLLPGYSVQVTVLDIDNIAGKEVVISIGKANKSIMHYIYYVTKSKFIYIGAVESKGMAKLVGNELHLTALNGVKDVYTLYQKQLVKVIK